MGLKSRVKGKVFERAIATKLREVWPEVVFRRASQADRAHQSDVYVVPGTGPLLLERLWWEMQDAANPTPDAKMDQAERDVLAGGVSTAARIPVVVWHRIRERTIWASLRASTFCDLFGTIPGGKLVARQRQSLAAEAALVTVPFDGLIDILRSVTGHENGKTGACEA